jgi:hypothetical protein
MPAGITLNLNTHTVRGLDRNPFQVFHALREHSKGGGYAPTGIESGLHDAVQLHVPLDISMTITVATTDFDNFTELSRSMFGGQSHDLIEKIARTKFQRPQYGEALSNEYVGNDRIISLKFVLAGKETLVDVRVDIKGLLRLLCDSSVINPEKPSNIRFVLNDGTPKSDIAEEITMPIVTLRQTMFLYFTDLLHKISMDATLEISNVWINGHGLILDSAGAQRNTHVRMQPVGSPKSITNRWV